MRYMAKPAGYQREAHTEVRTQSLRGSYQVEGDLMTQSKEMYDLALSASLLLHPQKAKFVAIMIDPPWKGTALKLRYRTLTNK